MTSAIFADVVIFVYHRFGDDRHPSTNISIEKLRKDFDWLKKNNYQVMTLEEIVAKLEKKESFPKKTVAFTIDDAYKSFYQNGLEVFKEYNFPFTLFVVTNATQKGYGDYMSWEQIKEASKFGEVSLHTHTHPHMTQMSDTEIRNELESGIKIYTQAMGVKPAYFAYPYGEYDKRVRGLVKEYGFQAIFNQDAGAVSAQSNIYDIDRTAIGENTSMGYATSFKYLPVKWNIIRSKNNLDIIEGEVDSSITTIEIYVSGYGWERVPVTDGKFSYKFDKPIKLDRSRVIAKTAKMEQASIVVMKQKEERSDGK